MTRNGWLGVGAAVVAAGIGGWMWWSSDSSRMRGALDYEIQDRRKLYLGNGTGIRRPAVVEANRAYALIPEYRRIQAEGVSPDVPLYTLLLKAASDHFLEVLRPIAASHGHDVVAEVGAIRVLNASAPQPPDLTSEVVTALSAR